MYTGSPVNHRIATDTSTPTMPFSYAATAMALFRPLPHEQCAMKADARAAFEALDEQTKAALDPILFEHRDNMYAKHLELPLSL